MKTFLLRDVGLSVFRDLYRHPPCCTSRRIDYLEGLITGMRSLSMQQIYRSVRSVVFIPLPNCLLRVHLPESIMLNPGRLVQPIRLIVPSFRMNSERESIQQTWLLSLREIGQGMNVELVKKLLVNILSDCYRQPTI